MSDVQNSVDDIEKTENKNMKSEMTANNDQDGVNGTEDAVIMESKAMEGQGELPQEGSNTIAKKARARREQQKIKKEKAKSDSVVGPKFSLSYLKNLLLEVRSLVMNSFPVKSIQEYLYKEKDKTTVPETVAPKDNTTVKKKKESKKKMESEAESLDSKEKDSVAEQGFSVENDAAKENDKVELQESLEEISKLESEENIVISDDQSQKKLNDKDDKALDDINKDGMQLSQGNEASLPDQPNSLPAKPKSNEPALPDK